MIYDETPGGPGEARIEAAYGDRKLRNYADLGARISQAEYADYLKNYRPRQQAYLNEISRNDSTAINSFIRNTQFGVGRKEEQTTAASARQRGRLGVQLSGRQQQTVERLTSLSNALLADGTANAARRGIANQNLAELEDANAQGRAAIESITKGAHQVSEWHAQIRAYNKSRSGAFTGNLIRGFGNLLGRAVGIF